MFQVGDALTHERFLSALTKTHGYDGRVEAWFDGNLVDQIEFGSGSVKVTARNRERRSLEFAAPEKLWPALPTDPLTPYGAWLRAYVTVTAGATAFPEIPVFAGRLSQVEGNRWEGDLRVSAVDPMWQVNREPFERLRPAPSASRIVDAVRQLLVEVFPEATLEDQTGSTATVPAGLMWDAKPGSRGKAIDELAASIGAEVYARPTAVWPGGDFVIRPVPSLAGPVDWTLPDGLVSIVEGDKRVQSGAAVVNRWIVEVQRQDAPTLYVPVTDSDPASPTRYGGPMGKLAAFYSSPLISDEAQGFNAGLAKLRRSIGLARQRTLRVAVNPALEAGDVMSVSVDGESLETHIADEFAAPLQHDPASMDIATRSAGGVE